MSLHPLHTGPEPGESSKSVAGQSVLDFRGGGAVRSRETPQVGVIYNPRSHHNKGQDLASDPAPHVFIAQPDDHGEMPEALKRFRRRGIDLLVINGGDGTVRDVLTKGLPVFGDDWPAIAVLPKGKTNALTVDLGAPKGWTLQEAIDAFEAGRSIKRHPLAVTPLGSSGETLLGFILGAGAYAKGINAGQDAHRIGAFNSLAVGVTTSWGILSALLGSRDNPWRKGVQIDIKIGSGREALAHSGHGDPGWRQLLMVSTLNRFPMGIRPFSETDLPIRIAVLDQAQRRNLVLVPLVVAGWRPRDLARRGFHQLGAEQLEIDIDGEFILDGEAFDSGRYRIASGPQLEFVTP